MTIYVRRKGGTVDLQAVRRRRKVLFRIKNVGFGWEDVIPILGVVFIAGGWVRGDLDTAGALQYLGLSATGGLWGFLSGKEEE